MSTPFDFPIIVLAAGQSSRMRGRDKLLEIVRGQPLLQRVVQMARTATTADVLVALPSPPHPRYDVIENTDVTPVPVLNATEGMNASLRAAFAALPLGTPHAMLILADMPDMTARDLRLVAAAVLNHPDQRVWRGATQSGAPGHPIVFHHCLFPAFARMTGDDGGKGVISQAKGRVRIVPLPGNRARLDLDTPEEWDAWHAKQAK